MNLLSLLSHEYEPELIYNRITEYWELRFRCNKINDTDCYDQLTKDDLKILRDNAKRILDNLSNHWLEIYGS
mgnify:FL=1